MKSDRTFVKKAKIDVSSMYIMHFEFFNHNLL